MSDKNEPKNPQPQNAAPRERPPMPENRVIKGNDPKLGGIKATK